MIENSQLLFQSPIRKNYNKIRENYIMWFEIYFYDILYKNNIEGDSSK